ncbi:MAG: hypothetical protein L0211_18730 [Planctomycetaceae bacterium]|nr:hypothetical protein [Planctomycetaceae bacterium]
MGEMNGAAEEGMVRKGFSLSGLFVLMTACAAIVAGFTPLVRLAGEGRVDGFQLSVSLATGFLGGLFLGLIVGLLHFRSTLAAPIGAGTGAVVGLAAGLVALLPQGLLVTSALTTLIGSAMVIGVALIHRRVNG